MTDHGPNRDLSNCGGRQPVAARTLRAHQAAARVTLAQAVHGIESPQARAALVGLEQVRKEEGI